ncbi:oxidoreductase FAD/NAD(P)-binding domain-containing protein, partial [Acidithiobacillus sp. GGI-221]
MERRFVLQRTKRHKDEHIMTNYDITIHTRDKQQVSFVCSEAEDLLSAADRESILLPSQCRKGTCGACVATV